MTDPYEFDDRDSVEELSDLEVALRDAGGLVEVSDDLRSRTLEHARRLSHDRRVRRRVLLAALAWLPLSLVMHSQEFGRVAPSGPISVETITTSQDAFVLADAMANEKRTDLSWALVDVFQGLRRSRIERLSSSDP